MKNKIILGLVVCLMFILSNSSFAQKVLLDEGVRAGELQFFPVLGAENNYYYLLDKVRIAQKNGKPQFSFIKYEKVVRNNANSSGQAEAGGFLHALVEFHIPEEMKKEAERALRRLNPSAKVLGPVMYESGKVAVISALQDDQEGKYIKRVVGVGPAPILEGQKMAIGMELSRDGAEFLMASFEMPASQISLAFNMSLQGYRSPKKIKIRAHFDEIYAHQAFEAAAVTPVFAAEINKAYEDLRTSKAIEVIFQGEDEGLEKAFDVVYEKLTKLLFEPLGTNGTPDLNQLTNKQGGQKSMLDRMTAMLGTARKEAKEEIKEMIQFVKADPNRKDIDYEAINYHLNRLYMKHKDENGNKNGESKTQELDIEVPELAVGISYQMKKIRKQGTYDVNLEKYGTGTIPIPFSENLSISPRDCPACFRVVNLDNLFGKQKEITVQLDGLNRTDFTNYINFVNVKLRKTHENGQVSFDEVSIDRIKFNDAANNYRMFYGTGSGDQDVDLWHQYDYQVTWNFFGGQSIETDWKKDNKDRISLSPPLLRKNISFEADKELMTNLGVRSIIIQTFYNNQPYAEQRINTGKDIFEETVNAIVPTQGNTGYQYEVSWFFRDSDKNFTSERQVGKMTLVDLISSLDK